MAWFFAILLVGILAFFVFSYSERLTNKECAEVRWWFLGWTVKGLVAPLAIWVLFNSGYFERMPTFITRIDFAQSGAPRFDAIVDAAAAGFWIIGSYWAALTSAWLLVSFGKRPDASDDFKAHCGIWSLFLAPLALVIIFFGGWYFAGLALAIWLMPLLHIIDSVTFVPVKKPTYSRAIARMQMDKYEDAEVAVIDELERCEDDFDGWMLLAELYAVHFHDLDEAERTIHDTCANPNTTDSQRSIALQKMADWHLKLANDAVAARRDLEEICRLLPGTHLARMARGRMSQLPQTNAEWNSQHQSKTYRLPALRADFDSSTTAEASPTSGTDAANRARLLSEKLGQNPDDVDAREELARLMAENLGKVDAGLEQLDLLLTIPGQPESRRAEWLALAAAWRLKFKRDEPAARRILERLVRDFPQSAQGFAAQRRLNLMDIEAKIRARAAATEATRIELKET